MTPACSPKPLASLGLGQVTKFVMQLSLLTAACVASAGGSRGGDGGGGIPAKLDSASLEVYLNSGGIKRAMNNYLQSLSVSKISDSQIRNDISFMVRNERLQSDIEKSEYVVGTNCKELNNVKTNDKIYASAKFGDLGGPICFDVEALAGEYRALTNEEGAIKLAALAFHEHVHHFQLTEEMPADNDHFAPASVEANENAANRTAGYIQNTAKFASEPVLRWDPTADEYQGFECGSFSLLVSNNDIKVIAANGNSNPVHGPGPGMVRVANTYTGTRVFSFDPAAQPFEQSKLAKKSILFKFGKDAKHPNFSPKFMLVGKSLMNGEEMGKISQYEEWSNAHFHSWHGESICQPSEKVTLEYFERIKNLPTNDKICGFYPSGNGQSDGGVDIPCDSEMYESNDK